MVFTVYPRGSAFDRLASQSTYYYVTIAVGVTLVLFQNTDHTLLVGCEEPHWPANGTFTTMMFSRAPGSLITFSCNGGLFPSEPMSSICQDSGLWMPDLTEIVCHIPDLSEGT